MALRKPPGYCTQVWVVILWTFGTLIIFSLTTIFGASTGIALIRLRRNIRDKRWKEPLATPPPSLSPRSFLL